MVSVSRRQFVAAVPLKLGGASIFSAWSRGYDPDGYDAVAERVRRASALVGAECAPLSQELIERVALPSTALGIRRSRLNQPVEVQSVRPQFAVTLGLTGQRPDMVIRFGRGPTMPLSLRRPVQAVLV